MTQQNRVRKLINLYITTVKHGFILQKVDKRPPTDEPPTEQLSKMRRYDDSSPSTFM